MTGISAGTATIRATAGGVSGTAAIQVENLAFVDLSAGGLHACALTATGKLYCWGDHKNAAAIAGTEECVGGPCRTTPATSSSWPTLVRVSLGGEYSCALAGDGTARCWGRNLAFQLGAASSQTCSLINGSDFPCSRQPLTAAGGRSFTAISTGALHSCGVTAQGAAWCWGFGDNGRLGVTATGGVRDAQQVPAVATFTSIAAGGSHTCGLSTQGAAWCWGDNTYGQLGVTKGTGGPAPQQVSGAQLASITTGANHTCALATNGAAWCWGQNNYGQLGDGTNADSDAPRPVSGGLTFTAISAGGEHTCAITAQGSAYCWGHNRFGSAIAGNPAGQLGDGTTNDRVVPTAVAGGLAFAQIASGRSFTCGRTSAGKVYCWGDTRFGQVGDGDHRRATGTSPFRTSPVGVAGVR